MGDYFGSYQSATMIQPTLILYQGLVRGDPTTHQIGRMRTELLAPRNDVGSARTSDHVDGSDSMGTGSDPGGCYAKAFGDLESQHPGQQGDGF
jgi:hypothetical protein